MYIKLLIVLHVLGACIWAGGHLILCVTILPNAWRNRDIDAIQRFEEPYEKIGIPALVIQQITGVLMALNYLPFSDWRGLDTVMSQHICLKFFLLFITIALALHARFFIIPKLKPENIGTLGIHIIGITVIAILFVITGVSVRFGILF